MWPAEQGNNLSLWTQHQKSCIQCWSLMFKVQLWRPVGPFFVMTTQSNGHKLWLERFRLNLEEMCSMRPVQPWISVQKGGEILVLWHFPTTDIPTNFYDSKGTAQKLQVVLSPTSNTLKALLFLIILRWNRFFSCSRGRRDIISCFLCIFPDGSRSYVRGPMTGPMT